MKKTLLLFALLVYAWVGKAQNLVPNGDFEAYATCPGVLSQLNQALPWFSPTNATPDYFNQCSSPLFAGVPINFIGFQNAHSGIGYAGIIQYEQNSTYNEYIEVPLTAPLNVNICYHFEMYINLANRSMFKTDDIGVYFSDTAYTDYTMDSVIPLTPQVINSVGSFPDTVNWMQISGTYTATGGESYLIIGNFNDTTNTNVVVANNAFIFTYAYIYIDDVSLTPCTGTDNPIQPEAIKISPNPTKDILNISFFIPTNENAQLKIFDVMGKEIFSQQVSNAPNASGLQLPVSALPAGMYFVTIVGEKINETGKFVKE